MILVLFLILTFDLFRVKEGEQQQNATPDNTCYQSQRQKMVQEQIEARGIRDYRVIQAMLTVPRHLFVAKTLTSLAYQDYPLPIPQNQTISQPYIVAYMSELAAISPQAKVLEIGTGSGYQTAILGLLAKEVYTIEFFPELAHKARYLLQKLGYNNIHYHIGDGYQGWAEHAPYNAILVTAAPNHIPQPLIEQLAIKGNMIIPIGEWHQHLVMLTKTEEGLVANKTIPVRFVPLIHLN